MKQLWARQILKAIRAVFFEIPNLSDLQEVFDKHEPAILLTIEVPNFDFDNWAETLSDFGIEVSELAKRKRVPWHLEKVQDVINFSENVEEYIALMPDEEKAFNLIGCLAFAPSAAIVRSMRNYADSMMEMLKKHHI